MTRRAGFSLIEVLVAVFIMGIGMIAILTLFPLGAFNMANAVREERSAQIGTGADGYFRAYWKTQIVEPVQAGQNVTEPFYTALDNPGGGLSQAATTEVSYPVFVDAVGYAARGGNNQLWVGDLNNNNPTTFVPRRSIEGLKINGVFDNNLVFRVCSQWDGIGWDDDSQKITKDREVRYNWLCVIQRKDNSLKTTA